jgi:hypothetical protein
LRIIEFESLKNHQLALTPQNGPSEGSATFINLSAGGSGAISSAGIVSDSVANASSAGASGAISFAGIASGSAAEISSASVAASQISAMSSPGGSGPISSAGTASGSVLAWARFLLISLEQTRLVCVASRIGSPIILDLFVGI